MGVCLLCSEQVSRKLSDSVTCVKCNGLAHFNCINVNISKQSFESLKKVTSAFVCNKCRPKSAGSDTSGRRQSSASVNEQNTSESSDKNDLGADITPAVINAIQKAIAQGQEVALVKSTEVITKLFNNFEQKQMKFNASLNTSIIEMKNSIADNSSRIDQLEFKSDKQEEELGRVKSELAKLNDKIVSLEENIHKNDQALLSTSLEIHGLPLCENENLTKIFETVMKHLNVEFNNREPIVLAKLSNQNVRDEIIAKRKKCSIFTVSALGLGINDNSTIYIRETLAHVNRMIYSAALKLRRDGKLKFLWLSDGKIFGRKADGSPRVHLHNLEALNKFQ